MPGAEGLFATGDDDGAVKLWDVRQQREVASFTAHEDYVSDFTHSPTADSKTLISTSGDGTLAAYNMRRGKLDERSDQNETELLSCVPLKRGKLLVAGSNEASL